MILQPALSEICLLLVGLAQAVAMAMLMQLAVPALTVVLLR